MFRLLSAFVFAPFLVALLGRFVLGSGESIGALATGALVHAALVLVVAVPLGLALFAVAWKLKRLQWYWAAAGGAIIGMLFFGPAFVPTFFDDGLRDWKKIEALEDLAGFVMYTTVIALATWVLGIWRNPALWTRRDEVARRAV
ncbi:hypothetical protein [Caenimonas koreensis]|uniref:hypothetical protein n=1 Tax=Caenimonas koreensis TaxID=367474 RepID=UPI003782E0BC